MTSTTTDSQWLEEQLQRIAPARTDDLQALRTLAIDLRIALVTMSEGMAYLRECVHDAMGQRDALRFDMALLRDQVAAVPVDAHLAAHMAKIDASRMKNNASGQPKAEPLTDFDIRGKLASELTCWHRLTADEESELVELFHLVIQGGAT